MVQSVHDVIGAAREAYTKEPRTEWVLHWPGQVVLCVSQIYWTQEVHEAIQGGTRGLKEFYNKSQVFLNVLFEVSSP